MLLDSDKTIVSICENQPLALNEFFDKKVLIGKQKVAKYGDEIVKMVRDYCVETEITDNTEGGHIMTEKEKILYAKEYIDKLAGGINPIDDSIIPDGDVVNNVKVSRCLFYVSEILQQIIEDGKKSSLVDDTTDEKKELKREKDRFEISAEDLLNFRFSKKAISLSEILDRMAEICPNERRVKVSRKAITDWLESIGLLEKVETRDGRKTHRPTSEGENVGIIVEERESMYGTRQVVVYTEDAQSFIVDNLDCVFSFDEKNHKQKPENHGAAWSEEEDGCLVEMFNNGATVSQIAKELKRTNGGIRSRLKKQGLIE